jgi:RNA polymerase sigma-70 factor (ECF subfamily)
MSAIKERLSKITTIWTEVVRAHSSSVDTALAAQSALVERYRDAVYSYLLGALRDFDAADELFQEFALKLVRGDLGRADPERGRFRDYVKAVLINMVNNYRRIKGRMPAQGADVPEPEAAPTVAFDSDRAFLTNWCKALLDRAWEGLAAAQTPHGPPFYSALRLRMECPGLTSAELSEKVTAQHCPENPITDANLRKVLQRARELFSDLLVEEVARSLQTHATEVIERELIDLGFHSHCRRALERRRNRG